MTSAATSVPTHLEPELAGQTVVVIGGSAGIGLETARRARGEGARVIITGRNPDRLKQAALEVGAERTAAFDANDAAALKSFFQDLPTPIDHVMVTAGSPTYGPLLEMDTAKVREAISGHVVLGLEVARNAADKIRPGGTLLLMGGTGGRRVGHGLGIASAATAALPPFTAALALELHRFASISSLQALSTPRCRHRCWEIDSRSAGTSFGRRYRSAASLPPPTSPRSPCTS
jgi:short-subunit dehydrogenase